MSGELTNPAGAAAGGLDTAYLPAAVLDALTSHVAVLDRVGTIIAVNAAWDEFARGEGDPTLEHTGVGLNYLDVCRRAAGTDAVRSLVGIEAVLAETLPRFSMEYPCHSLTQQRWYLLQATPLVAPGGGAVVVHTNITEHKQAEVERASRTGQLRDLAAASLHINAALSMEAVLQAITDQARAIIGAHQAITSLTADQDSVHTLTTVSISEKYATWRKSAAQLAGSRLYALVCHDNRPTRLMQCEIEANPVYHELGAQADGHLPLRGWMAAPLVGRDGRNLGLIQLSDKYTDEFTEADEAILVQLAQLASVAIENSRLYSAAQQALQVRNEFLSVAAHELKTPLTALLGNAELVQRRLVREGNLHERTQHSLEVLVVQARRLNKMIGDLLDLSRLETGQLRLEMVALDLHALVRRALAEVEPALTNHTLAYAGTDSAVTVVGDELRLEQVLHNLIQNAIKYSPDGGTVTVGLEQEPEVIRLWIADQGIGIPREALPNLFRRFFRADNAAARQISGVGIGLYVVHEIVERHGGTIDVASTEGAGSTFTVCLPIHRQPST